MPRHKLSLAVFPAYRLCSFWHCARFAFFFSLLFDVLFFLQLSFLFYFDFDYLIVGDGVLTGFENVWTLFSPWKVKLTSLFLHHNVVNFSGIFRARALETVNLTGGARPRLW